MDNIRLDNIPLQRRRELLRDHPDTITVEFAGKKRHWFFGGATYDAARDTVDLSSVLREHEESEQGIDAFCYLLWAGFAVFGTELTPAEIKLRMSIGEMNRIQPKILPAIQGKVQEPDADGSQSVGNVTRPRIRETTEAKAQGAAVKASPETPSAATATASDSVATAS